MFLLFCVSVSLFQDSRMFFRVIMSILLWPIPIFLEENILEWVFSSLIPRFQSNLVPPQNKTGYVPAHVHYLLINSIVKETFLVG